MTKSLAVAIGLVLLVSPAPSLAQDVPATPPAPSRILAPGAQVEKLAAISSLPRAHRPIAKAMFTSSTRTTTGLLKYDTAGTLTTFMQPSNYPTGCPSTAMASSSPARTRRTSCGPSTSRRRSLRSWRRIRRQAAQRSERIWVQPKTGRIYFTDPYYQRKWWSRGPKESPEAVYVYTPADHKLARVVEDMVQPNGIIGTPDGKKLYIADIRGRKTFSVQHQRRRHSGQQAAVRRVRLGRHDHRLRRQCLPHDRVARYRSSIQRGREDRNDRRSRSAGRISASAGRMARRCSSPRAPGSTR